MKLHKTDLYFSKYALLNYQHWVKGIVGTVELMIFYFFYLVTFSEQFRTDQKKSPIWLYNTIQAYADFARLVDPISTLEGGGQIIPTKILLAPPDF